MLQGDCLSPLLFNMCFNTFLQYVKSSKFQQVGYKFNSRLAPRHWFQFADDASVVTGQQNENQLQLNAFTIWCNQAEMIIRVDKCKSFGIAKSGSTSKQFMPKLFVNNELIPTLEIGKSFKYLGRYYNYDMDDEEHKKNILETACELLHEVDSLPLHSKNEILLYKSCILSKLSWDFTISDISVTWVKTNIEMKVHEYFRHWF